MPGSLGLERRRGLVGGIRADRPAVSAANMAGPADEERREREREARGIQFRFAGLAFEFGAGVAGCVLLGYWIDRTFGTANKGVIAGALIGCVGGMYHLTTQAIRVQRRLQRLSQSKGPAADGDRNDDRTKPGD